MAPAEIVELLKDSLDGHPDLVGDNQPTAGGLELDGL